MAEKLPKPTKEDLIVAAGVFRRTGDAEKELACLINLWKGRDRRGVYNMIRDFRNHLTWRLGQCTEDRDLTVQLMGILKRAYILTARTFFDDYMIALEWDRPADRRFWIPRRRILYVVAQDMEALYYGKIRFLGVSLPPRVGKSTLGIFFMTWVMGNRPEVANLMTGHSDKLTDGFYREILSILTDHRTYNWSEIFPNVDIVDTSAKNETIDLKNRKRFPSFTARSISGTLTGAVEVGVGGILYCDDLVEDLEEALNPDRLDAKYQAYLNQLKDRKKDGALELMVGTRWNVFDPLGRIEEQYRDNPDYRFRVIPALNSAGKSNFDYPYKLGFTTKYYEDMKASIEDSEWAAKYMGSPYIREGLLYAEDTLRRYYRVPEGDPDAIWAVCDPAQGGGDDTFLPIFYQYGDDHYLVDCVCTDALPNVADALCAEKLVQWKVQQCQYEINAAGGRTADAVADKVREMGGGCSITKRHTQANKETKILANSTWVKDHILFLDAKMIPKGSMYEKMVRLLTLYTLTGKNQHDDVPDGLAQYALFIGSRSSNIVTLTKRFF